ncbi:hypothetical protein MMC22_007240 [Lobaria immixta]|nr:hypothetical protein [Lobaria immixta]
MTMALEGSQNFAKEEEESQQVLKSIEGLHLQQHNDISQSKPIVRYGSLWSQYHTLDASTIVSLEKAVLYCYVRAFKESLAIHHAFPKEVQLHPIVAFEKSLTLLALWRLKDCVDILQEAINKAKYNSSEESDAPGIYTLLRATLGLTNIYAKGDFTQARESLVEIRKWLLTTPIDEYKDLQVYCLNRYYLILAVASQHVETFDSKFFLCIPHVPNDTNGLNMVTLREFLQSRGRLQEAGLILNFELGFQPNQARSQEACMSLLEACRSNLAGQEVQEPVWYIEGKARLHLAKSFNGQCQHEQAAKEFGLAKNLLEQAPVSAALNRTEINIRSDELKSSADVNLHHSLQKWMDFAESLSELEDSSELSSARTNVAAAAHEILKSNASDGNWNRFRELQSLEESMLEELGDVYTIYFNHSTRLHNQISNYNGAGAILKWKQEFDLTHPNFSIWNLKILQSKRAMLIYKDLKDKDNVLKMLREICDLANARDDFWSGVDERYTVQTDMGQDQVSNSDEEERTNVAFHPTGKRNVWQSEWDKELSMDVGIHYKGSVATEGEGEIKRAEARLKTLLKWLKSGASRGELSKGDLDRILFPLCESLSTGSRIQSSKGIFVKSRVAENEDAEAEVDALLGKLTPTSLGIQVFGTDEYPPSSAHWQDVFAALRNWLFQRANYNETKRHILLLDLQIQMLWKVLDTGSLTQQALEAQRILDLIPTLCTEAREMQSLGFWRNILCEVKAAALKVENDIEAQCEDHPKFREIADLYEITLSERETQMNGRLSMRAVTLASLAALYSFPAWRGRPEAIEPFFRYCNLAEQSFERNRESWKLLRGWEKVEKLLKAVEEGLRQRISASAVLVLSRFQDSGVERDQRMWTKIQKEKSWGLGWLMQTNSLQGIEDGSVGKSATSDFQALPVVTLEDLQSVGSDTEGGVVYVDWYDGRRNTLGPNYSSNVLLLTLSVGELPKSWQLDITWAKVDALVKKFLECDEDDLLNGEASKILQKLNPLVQPLRQVSKPGQVLVFSAIGDLHRIPLHALKIDKEVLIRRNPVVYCSSMTVLNVLFGERKKHEEKAKNDGHRFGLTLCLGDISDDGIASQDSLVQMFATKGVKMEPLRDDTFTSEKFKTAIRGPALDLFHYHGHATFVSTDSLNQGLEFHDRRLNLREVFELAPLSTSYHATLLGCGSGKSKTSTSNDVLGLVSAFLYSGASSTVSALWTRIADKDAILYSEHFYSYFEHALENSADESFRVINLATANQKAVLKIMEERKELYHWAPFVLNGYWMHRVPPLYVEQ